MSVEIEIELDQLSNDGQFYGRVVIELVARSKAKADCLFNQNFE